MLYNKVNGEKIFSHSPDFMKMSIFLKLFTAYVIGLIFFMGVLPRVIINTIGVEDTAENPFKYSHVLINY